MSKFNYKFVGLFLLLALLCFYLLLQFFTLSTPYLYSYGYSRLTTCSPEESARKFRQYLSNRVPPIGTSEPSTEGEAVIIFTQPMVEQKGKRERRTKFKLVFRPLSVSDSAADFSTFSLSSEKSEIKGIREKQWYEDTESTSNFQGQLWQEVQGICPERADISK